MKMVTVDEGSPSMKHLGLGLGLGLGLCLGNGGPSSKSSIRSISMASDASESSRDRRRECGLYHVFTRAQLEELSLQLLIFSYFASALFPPFQLLLPIFSSLPSFYPSFHLLHFPHQQPSLCLELGNSELDRRYVMDQPSRCRRTDGKRWRCSREVIPNEKYCEKHIHRGCGRSRKLVESSIGKPSYSNQLNGLNLNLVEGSCTDLSTAKVLLKDRLKIDNSRGKDQKIDDSEDRRRNDGATKISIKPPSFAITSGKLVITGKQHKLGNDNGFVYERVKDQQIVVEEKLASAGKNDKVDGNTETGNTTSKKSDAMGFEFSPKSVLREGDSFPGVNQCNAHLAVTKELEPNRCRRTDGKRWRCREEVIADDQKYCVKHMHRGAKKRMVTPQEGEVNPFALVKRANKVVVGFDTKI